MNSTVKMLAAASLAMVVALPLSAQNSGETMLLSAIKNETETMGFSSEQLDALSLNDLVSIATIVNSDESDSNKRQKIETIIEAAN